MRQNTDKIFLWGGLLYRVTCLNKHVVWVDPPKHDMWAAMQARKVISMVEIMLENDCMMANMTSTLLG